MEKVERKRNGFIRHLVELCSSELGGGASKYLARTLDKMRGLPQRKPRVLTRNAGFTLIEILIVVAIIGLIAALIGPNLMGRFEKSKEEITKAQVEMLSSAVQAFMIDMRRYPNSLDELINSTDPQWRGPYLSKRTIPKDPWGRDYQFKCPGDHGPFDLYSLGPEGKLGERSIANW
jgi:general secretion pathway protein G